ncbi:MAG: molybdenum cofactor biosynthesis protein MoaE [Bradymonadaceae bacterium]
MEVQVRYFAGVREMVGRESERLEIPGAEEGATVADCWEALIDRHPRLEQVREDVRVAVDREFSDAEAAVESGAELSLIPPVSGGCGARFAIVDEPLDAESVRARVERDGAGAVVVFRGVVRDHTGDREVRALEYEAHREMAEEKLREIGDEIAGAVEEVEVAAHHRVGRLEVGEVAVVVAASSPHRAEAFEANRRLIDRLKEDVPIWKKEVGTEGEEWVGWTG